MIEALMEYTVMRYKKCLFMSSVALPVMARHECFGINQ